MSKTILLADANAETKSQLTRLLEHADVNIQVATNAQQTIEMTADAYRHNHLFDLILVDWNLAGLSQADLIRSLRFAGHCAPILAIENENSESTADVHLFQSVDWDAIVKRPLTGKRTLCQIHDLMKLVAV